MKLKISLIGLFMASMEVVAGITTSKTIPISTTKSINTTKITSKSSLSSKTIPTSTSVKATPTVTQLDPNDFWYYGDDIYHKVLDKKCGLDSNNHRSLEAYKECMDQYEIYYNGYLKSYYEEKLIIIANGSKSIKTISSSSSVGSKSTKTISSSYGGGSNSTCPPKGAWVGMYMSDAITDCNSKQAAVRHYGNCIGNSPYYYCDLMHTKTLNEMKIIPYTNPSYVFRKRDLSNNDDNNISSTKTIPTLSSTKTIPTQNLNLNSSNRICDDNSDSSYHCCRNDQPVSVALVDSSGVWGIQLFGDKYDWCFYEDVKPVITYTITSTITTKIPPVSTSASTTTTTKIPPVSISSSTTTTTTTKIPPVSISSSTTTTTKIPPVSISSSTTTTTTTKIPPIITSTSSSCIPKTLTVTLTERETVTKKEYVTVTVTDHSAGETTPSEKCSGKWAQCGGVGFNGPTCCESGSTCHKINEYYSQCI